MPLTAGSPPSLKTRADGSPRASSQSLGTSLFFSSDLILIATQFAGGDTETGTHALMQNTHQVIRNDLEPLSFVPISL